MQAQVSNGIDHLTFKSRREQLGSQRVVAHLLGIGESTLQSYESGRAPIPITVGLAIEALATRRAHSENTARGRFQNAVDRFAMMLAEPDYGEAAHIWVAEIEPLTDAARDAHGPTAVADMHKLAEEAVKAASKTERIAAAVRKNFGALHSAHQQATSKIQRDAIAEIIAATT